MSEINELKNVMLEFIGEQRQFNKEQKEFNKEQKEFNKEQKQFNVDIDKKVDKVQYYLEETMASHTKMFFEEQMKLKSKVDVLNEKVFGLKNDLIDLTSQFKLFSKA
jgi:hypothetical protein